MRLNHAGCDPHPGTEETSLARRWQAESGRAALQFHISISTWLAAGLLANIQRRRNGAFEKGPHRYRHGTISARPAYDPRARQRLHLKREEIIRPSRDRSEHLRSDACERGFIAEDAPDSEVLKMRSLLPVCRDQLGERALDQRIERGAGGGAVVEESLDRGVSTIPTQEFEIVGRLFSEQQPLRFRFGTTSGRCTPRLVHSIRWYAFDPGRFINAASSILISAHFSRMPRLGHRAVF